MELQKHRFWAKNGFFDLALCKGKCPSLWQCLDITSFNSLVSQQLHGCVLSIRAVATALNQCAAFTKKYPPPQEDPAVSSLTHRAALSQGPARQQMLSDAAAIRPTKKRLKRQRQAETLSSGLWWQSQKIASAQPVPEPMSSAPGKSPKPRSRWSTLVEKYCARLFAGPLKEALLVSAFLAIARQRAAARRLALVWRADGNLHQGRLSYTLWDLKDCLSVMPRNKAVGADGLSTEILLALNITNQDYMASALERRLNAEDDVDFCQAFWQQFHLQVPDGPDHSWREALAILIAKTPKPQTLLDYRSIHLLPVLQKLYLRALGDSISAPVWASITTNQYGARPKHQGQQIIHSTRPLQEKAWETSMPLVLIKIDVKKAFDRTRRSVVMRSLLNVPGLDERLVYVLIREWAMPAVLPSISGQLALRAIDMKVGLRQGGSDSSLAFVIAIDAALKHAVRKWGHLQHGPGIPGLLAAHP